jgi:SpoVK/Ycf46/Vps4 family AAA+-type ATPase
VFLVATANDVSGLPPETLRKGRFDEIFSIDLPDVYERRDIFDIHLTKRDRTPKDFKVKAFAEATDTFTGSEIEQVIIGALFRAFSDGRELSDADVLAEVKETVPLAKTASEKIEAIRRWAANRARPANKSTEKKSKTKKAANRRRIG